jgi:glutamyl-tRNA reductase
MGHLLCLGLNHTTAPLSIREQLAFAPTPLHAALARFGPMHCSERLADIAEAAILSTCNRLEIYALVKEPDEAIDSLVGFLSEARNVPVETLRDHLYSYVGEEAVRHLMNVASGLDSLILGEPQILGQVVEAYRAAMTHGAVGTVLSRLFRRAIHAGKRARSETSISTSAASVSSVAVQLASHVFGDLADCEVLVAGAGEMGELAVRALMERGARGLLVANRTYDRAVQLARQWDGEAMTFERLSEGLTRADIVISATNAPHTILDRAEVETAMQSRADRPMFIIDIAVPRDVDDEVDSLPNVHLYNIDDLESQVENNLDGRRAEVPRVESIVDAEVQVFMGWLASLEVVPTISQLRKQAEVVRCAEVERALNRLDTLSDAEREVVLKLSTRLVNKLLHEPITCLKEEAASGNGVAYTQAMRHLFRLEQGS